MDVATEGLAKVVRLPANPFKLSEAELQDAKSDIVAYLLECLKVEINGDSVEAEPGALQPVYDKAVTTGERYISFARQQFRFRSTAEAAAHLAASPTDLHHSLCCEPN